MTDHEESSVPTLSRASSDKNTFLALVKNIYSGHGDLKQRWTIVNPREKSIDDRPCDIGPEAFVMEYRYGSTRCEDDPLENEKGIGVAVRDAPNRTSFSSDPLHGEPVRGCHDSARVNRVGLFSMTSSECHLPRFPESQVFISFS